MAVVPLLSGRPHELIKMLTEGEGGKQTREEGMGSWGAEVMM